QDSDRFGSRRAVEHDFPRRMLDLSTSGTFHDKQLGAPKRRQRERNDDHSHQLRVGLSRSGRKKLHERHGQLQELDRLMGLSVESHGWGEFRVRRRLSPFSDVRYRY